MKRNLLLRAAGACALASSIVVAVGCGEVVNETDEPAREVKACDENACVSSDLPGFACDDDGAECATHDCHGTPAETYVCNEGTWTARSDLFFDCGPYQCSVGAEYCEDVSDAGEDQKLRCVAVPQGCSYDGLCDCAQALAVCADATCATTGANGRVVSCW